MPQICNPHRSLLWQLPPLLTHQGSAWVPPGLQQSVMALKSGWSSLLCYSLWIRHRAGPVPCTHLCLYVSESTMCCSTCGSCKWTWEISGFFGPCCCWNVTQGSGRFQLWSLSLPMNVHFCSQDVRAPSTRAEIVKTKWTTFSVYSGVI